MNLDSVRLSNTQDQAIRNFNIAIGQQSRLYNGPGYDFYAFKSDVTAYFDDLKTFGTGTVVYDGYKFENIPLLYDLYKDLVITLSQDGFSKHSLLSNRVAEFYQNNHHFIRVGEESFSVDHPIDPGFYDLVYDGKIKILVKRFKTIQETIDSREYQKYFVAHESYYLFKDGIYYHVNSEKSFLALFPTRKKELQRFLKSKGIKYRKAPELALQTLANYQDNLSN